MPRLIEFWFLRVRVSVRATDLRPSITQLRVAEMVRRILQRAILTGACMDARRHSMVGILMSSAVELFSFILFDFSGCVADVFSRTGQFDASKLDLRDIGFDVEDVHMSKDLGRATVFWYVASIESISLTIHYHPSF